MKEWDGKHFGCSQGHSSLSSKSYYDMELSNPPKTPSFQILNVLKDMKRKPHFTDCPECSEAWEMRMAYVLAWKSKKPTTYLDRVKTLRVEMEKMV
jgi:hypothetical protein